MRAVRFHKHGSEDVIQVDEMATPEPRTDEVLVEVRAGSVNPVDRLYREGMIPPDGLPGISGTDVAGIVTGMGEGVTSFEIGERVFGTGMAGSQAATFAETAVVPADHLARLPQSVSFEAGAASAHAGGTAWRCLIDTGQLRPADTCLIHGGSGGVGHLAVQIGAVTGARVLATAGSESARQRVAELGADSVFDYHDDDLHDRIEAVAPDGVDVILDHYPEQYLEMDIALAANRGRIAHLSGGFPAISDTGRHREVRIEGVAMHNTPAISAVMRRIGALLASAHIEPIIAQRFSFEEVGAAQRMLETESVIGKLIVTP